MHTCAGASGAWCNFGVAAGDASASASASTLEPVLAVVVDEDLKTIDPIAVAASHAAREAAAEVS